MWIFGWGLDVDGCPGEGRKRHRVKLELYTLFLEVQNAGPQGPYSRNDGPRSRMREVSTVSF